VVINSCAVTNQAVVDSRKKARQAAHAGAKQVVVTGCWATLNPQEVLALGQMNLAVPNADKLNLVPQLLGLEKDTLNTREVARQPLPGKHFRTRAFIRAQDGCENFCTFCITRVARGKAVSMPAERVIADIQAALESGAREIVLSGVNLGFWGRDLQPARKLVDLIEMAADLNPGRLRLSSLEPWDMDEGIIHLMAEGRLCRHLHLPLQSGSAQILRRMGRRITPQEYRQWVEEIRAACPQAALTTDIMVGFPGESLELFEESLEFVRSMNFAGGHVFVFSPRPGTPAAGFPGLLTGDVGKLRSQQMRAVLAESSRCYRQSFVGQEVIVLWESAKPAGEGAWQLKGLTDNYLQVSAVGKRAIWNEFSLVKITGLNRDGLNGDIVAG
jgi:threonylcarbamoyladenosine tRNA methylthiotransferase MtaB